MAETEVALTDKLTRYRTKARREYIRRNEFANVQQSAGPDALSQDPRPWMKRALRRGTVSMAKAKKYSQGGPPRPNESAKRWEPDNWAGGMS